MTQPLDGGNDSGSDRSDRPGSIHFRKSSQCPVVIDDRRGEGLVSAHALLENLFRVIGSLGQRCTFNIAESFLLWADSYRRCRWSGRQDNSGAP